jgi:fumarate reductase flavoprotein subunit
MKRDYDVIIVGAGGAGLAAALTAADQGASVLLVDAADSAGGSTALSGGVYYAAGTSVQRARGIEGDTADAMYTYYMTLNQHKVEPALVRRLCDEAADGLEWLISLGVDFPADGLYASGVEGIARGHAAKGMGASITAALEGHLATRAIDISLNTRVDGLLLQDGAVGGIRVGGDEVTASAVVVTTGGMGNNPEMLARHYPDAAAQGDWAWYIGSKHCRGDGLGLGQSVGADLIGHNRGLLLMTPGFFRDLEVFLPEWLVYVNRDGRRFVNETTEYAVLSGVVKEQLAGECFALFDEDSRLNAKRSVHEYPSPSWSPDMLAQMAQKGKVFKGNTLLELAQNAGIRAATLAATVERYNSGCDAGADAAYFKDPAFLRPVRTAPFYAVRMKPSIVCLSSTGLRIDREAQVLDQADRVITGLFAAGETTGGVLGERYIGGGNSITNAITFGRVAGRNAVAFARESSK